MTNEVGRWRKRRPDWRRLGLLPKLPQQTGEAARDGTIQDRIAADTLDPRRLHRQHGRGLRLVRLRLVRPLFRQGVLPQGRPDRPAAEHRRGVRRGLPGPAAGGVADGSLCRPGGPARGPHRLGVADVPGLAGHRPVPGRGDDRSPGPDHTGAGAHPPGREPRRRIRDQRRLSIGDGGARAARLLVQLPVCHPGGGPAHGPGHAGGAAGGAEQRQLEAWGWRIPFFIGGRPWRWRWCGCGGGWRRRRRSPRGGPNAPPPCCCSPAIRARAWWSWA